MSKNQPVTEGLHRPRWSVMIPTYNRTKYLSQTLTSVLEQDLGPDAMQIEVIDNCSTSADIEAEINNISHNRVSFYRQPHILAQLLTSQPVFSVLVVTGSHST